MARQEMKIAKMAEWVEKGSTPAMVFNKFELKPMQRAILNCLMVSDVVANLPTGFGKSLLYQYPASLQKRNKKCIIVIVPLKALLWDSIREARDLGITAQEIDNKIISEHHRNDTLPQMLLATPEKVFASEGTMNFIESLHAQKKIRLLVIDECHCMCQWGHDFRPDYLRLQKLRQILDGVRLLAISATITAQTRAYLSQKLFLHTGHYFQASYHRHNLFYSVIKAGQKCQAKDYVRQYLKQNKLQNEPGIIYCQTISAAEALTKDLDDLKVGLFHSKLSQKMRKQTYDNFMDEKIKIIIGTICFGMGINKKNIRFVINIGISKSPENYYQESGRAGRDGLTAHCLIISYPGQTNSISFMISNGTGNAKQKSFQFAKLLSIDDYTEDDFQCRRKKLFLKLGQNFNSDACQKMCDNCRREKDDKNIKKLDFYKEVKKILEDLQVSKCFFTKKQLCNYLKGKAVQKSKRGKQSQLILGQQIKGIFSKQNMETIQKIVDGMVNKGVIIRNPNTKKSRFLVSYFKAANKNATRGFKDFTIMVYDRPKITKTETQNKINKFDKFLQKKGVPTISKLPSLEGTVQKKQNVQNQGLMEAEVVKQKQNYESFFDELFGNDLLIDAEKKQESMEEYVDLQELEPIQITQEYEDDRFMLTDFQEKQYNNSKIIELGQPLFKIQKKPIKQSLKRVTLGDNTISDQQF